MIDSDHPIVARLLSAGFRVSASVYLDPEGRPPRALVMAFDGSKSFRGVSKRGDLAEALRQLGKVAAPLWSGQD